MTNETHSATVSPADTGYIAKVGETVIARSASAKILQEVNGEKTYRPVVYFPLDDVNRAVLAPSDHRTHCPIKGDASYYSIAANGETLENAAWTYPEPFDMVAGIRDHLAFYPDKVSVEKA